MNLLTIRDIWALFGVILFVIFFLLTFVKETREPVAIVAVISLYAGVILESFSIFYLVYNGIGRLIRKCRKRPI